MYPSQKRYNTAAGASSSGSRYSDESQESRSTVPTSIHSHEYEASPSFSPRSSSETYASTVASLEELCEEPETYDADYDVPEYREVVAGSDLRPTTPQEFADYFPSTKRLFIRHDNTSYDGNMNLRVDTEIPSSKRRKENVQLFHLRMFDLKKREFSFRRYERSSGREICHTSLKHTKAAPQQRPALTRSVSNAFASIRRPDFKRTNSGLSTHSQKSRQNIKRQDSGYASHGEASENDEDLFPDEKPSGTPAPTQSSTNTTKLDFSNYAQVEVTRWGKKSAHIRYSFEYWGHTYTWKRIIEKDGAGKAVSYHLYRGDDDSHAVAHVVPELRSSAEMRKEAAAGCWVAPSSMWIGEQRAVEGGADVADVIVATGLIVLVDDSIRTHFRASKKPAHQMSPKAMVEHIFKPRAETKERGSPLKRGGGGPR